MTRRKKRDSVVEWRVSQTLGKSLDAFTVLERCSSAVRGGDDVEDPRQLAALDNPADDQAGFQIADYLSFKRFVMLDLGNIS